VTVSWPLRIVGFLTVLIQQDRQPIRNRSQCFRSDFSRDAAEAGFRLFSGAVVHPHRQVGEEVANYGDMFSTDIPPACAAAVVISLGSRCTSVLRQEFVEDMS
jgi:hypothetical protein